MKYFYSLTKDGYLFIWKWVDDFLTEEYKNLKDHLNKAHISGLITNYERLPLYCMSPDEEN